MDNNPLLDVSFENIFSYSLACLLILLILTSMEEKVLILMKSSLLVISFVDHVFGVVSKKASPYPGSLSFSPMLSSRNFIVCTLH